MYIISVYTYVAGSNPNSEEAVNNLIRILDEGFKDQYSLEIINLFEKPELAEREDIFATPTVIKSFPLPARRIIGDLSDKEKVLRGLGLMSDSKQ